MLVVLRQIKHPIVIPIILTEHVQTPDVVREPFKNTMGWMFVHLLQIVLPIVLPIILMEHVNRPLVVRKQLNNIMG